MFQNNKCTTVDLQTLVHSDEPIAINRVVIELSNTDANGDLITEEFGCAVPISRGRMYSLDGVELRACLDRWNIKLTNLSRTSRNEQSVILKELNSDKYLKVGLHLHVTARPSSPTGIVCVCGWCDNPELIDDYSGFPISSNLSVRAKFIGVELCNA